MDIAEEIKKATEKVCEEIAKRVLEEATAKFRKEAEDALHKVLTEFAVYVLKEHDLEFRGTQIKVRIEDRRTKGEQV